VEGQGLGRPGLECSTFHGFCWCLCRYLSHKRWRSMQLLPGVDPRSVTFADMESLVMPLTEKTRVLWGECGVAVLELTLYWTSSATIFNPVMYLKVLSEGYFVKNVRKFHQGEKSGVSESVVIWSIGECIQVQRLPPSWRCQGMRPSFVVPGQFGSSKSCAF